MLKKTIEYTNFNDEKVTEDFYFNFTKAEVAEMEFSKVGGLEKHFKRAIASENAPEVMAIFKEILSKAYGRRSEDGKRFIKKPEYWAEFEQTGAYSELFMELMTQPEYSAEFFAATLPKDLAEKFAKGEDLVKLPEGMTKDEPKSEPEVERTYSYNELIAMPQDEFDKAAGTDPQRWDRIQLSAAYTRKTKQ